MSELLDRSRLRWKNGRPQLVQPLETSPAARGMNKLEEEYASLLEARPDVLSWSFEPLRFRLAGGAWYKPDFGVILKPDGRPARYELHETKGHSREAARVRIKTAAELHPEFRFVAVKKDAGGWHFESMPPHHKEV